jgi:hypothetical protein
VFDRRRSVLAVMRTTSRQWNLCVADGERCLSAVGAQNELETALRAWLSPLSPPPADRLSDLE